MKSASGPIVARLEELELIPSSGTVFLGRLVPGILFVLLLAFGGAKIMVGLNRNRPVELLVLLCVLTLAISIPFVFAASKRTWRGGKVLSLLQRDYAAAQRAASRSESEANPAGLHLAMGLALLGPAVLAGSAFGDLHRLMLPPSSGGSGCSGTSGCGSGCGGGGGGCGGGGCGGCGGGGD
jgi:uncharacterized protein (TIGR04222 family)